MQYALTQTLCYSNATVKYVGEITELDVNAKIRMCECRLHLESLALTNDDYVRPLVTGGECGD